MRPETLALGLAALWVAAAPSDAGAQTIVVPNALETVEGDTDNAAPFFLGTVWSSYRYQQLYKASEFGAISGPVGITEIAFRSDAEQGGPFLATLPDVEMRMSTTIGLGPVFDLNVGSDERVVLLRGPLTLASTDSGPPAGPKDWEAVIPLDRTFNYDPAQGALLLDLFVYDAGMVPISVLDACQDEMGRVLCGSESCSVDDESGFQDTLGLVTRFTLPEPRAARGATGALLALGVLALRSALQRPAAPPRPLPDRGPQRAGAAWRYQQI